MARKKRHEEHVNHERWLVSYADFITLLFAFFVVMFAVSQVDSNKVGRFSESVRSASKWQIFEEETKGPVPVMADESGAQAEMKTDSNGKTGQNMSELFGRIKERLEDTLKESILSGRVQLVEGPDGLIIRLRDSAYFPAGSSQIKGEYTRDLSAVATGIRDIKTPIRIEGHTDATPIKNTMYRSNWDLSAARAASVLGFFSSQSVSEENMSIVGYADRRPVAPNASEEGRRRNRRVDIVLLRPETTRNAKL
jgi:chemotaxis protein MotB